MLIRKAGRERDVGKVLSKSKKYIYLRIDGENLPWSEDDRIVPYLTWTIELNLIPGLGSLKRLCCVWLPNAPVPVSPSVTADTSWEASGRDPVCLLLGVSSNTSESAGQMIWSYLYTVESTVQEESEIYVY